MGDWTGGYVSDVEYVPGFYGEQAPGMIDLACLMSGVEPPRRPGSNEAFTYCDLGCGQGGTVAALAAANPAGRFWGIDLMPAHIARAEQFRAAAGLDNLTLIEADVLSLATAADPGLPQFDYIAMHGLFSWVSPEVRAGIVRFLERFLRPGGAAYLGYNVLPGWVDTIGTQKLLYEFAATRQGSSLDRLVEATGALRQLMDVGARGLDTGLRERLFPDTKSPDALQRNHRYLAHEFLNSHWAPRFHIDVARELAPAKLDFVGSANPLENFAGIGLSPEARALLETVPAGPLRETVEDYLNMRRFRRDVFVRGKREITLRIREELYSDVALVLRGPRPAPDQSEWPMLKMSFSLQPATYGPVFDRLEAGPATIADLREAVQRAGGEITGNELAGLMTGLDLVFPVFQDVPGAGLASCLRHNRALLHEAFRSVRQTAYALAVPAGHSAIALNPIHALVVDGLLQGVAPTVETMLDHVFRRGEIDPDVLQEVGVQRKGAAGDESGMADPGAAGGEDGGPPDAAAGAGGQVQRATGEIVRDVVTEALEGLLPLWRNLGLVPPARQP